MCVLIVKPMGIKLPTKNIMSACCKANPEGFGFATPSTLYKTTNKADFTKALYQIDQNEPAIIHCRWATHGSIKDANCHPFKVDNWIFAHNGMLSIQSVNDMTDSEIAFNSIFMPQIKAKGIDNAATQRVINNVRGTSRFAFLNTETGVIYTFGNFESINGVLFSNTRWQSQVATSRSYTYRSNPFYSDIFKY